MKNRMSEVLEAEKPASRNGKHTEKSAPQGAVAVTIPAINIGILKVRLVGDSPLVTHAWDDKAKKMMLDKQMKKAKTAREAKDPKADYEASIYRMPDGSCGFPAIAFKSAAVDACSFIDGMTKVFARGAFHVVGDLVKIEGEPTMRQDMVRIAMGTSDIRFRAQFVKWACELTIRYNSSAISPEQIVNLMNVAGFAVGVGEHRPARDGSWGMYHVEVEHESK